MRYNLNSPNKLLERCDLNDLSNWFKKEINQVAGNSVTHVLSIVSENLGSYVRWPKNAILLWKGCDRITRGEAKLKYHKYPPEIHSEALKRFIKLDTRANGPAITPYMWAGGERPKRFGSSNAWSIHHLYSGKFPYFAKSSTTHAAKHCDHFTQSAGLIATHPIADALVDEFPFFAWLLRAQAFIRFGYDPDGVFSLNQDPLGFADGYSCEIIFEDNGSNT